MIDLLIDCGIFVEVAAGRGNYTQLSGVSTSELNYCPPQDEVTEEALPTRPPRSSAAPENPCHTPSTISFIRSRMLYARAALNARGLVHFGLRHIRKLPNSPFVISQSNAVV